MFSRRVILINLLVITVILIIAEVISRAVIANVYTRSFDSALIKDNAYNTSSGLYPNKQGVVWGLPFATDVFGCRKTSKPFDKKKKTWLFIGDSVTQGVGVEDSSTFASIVADEIDSVNVLNLSMIGWSVADYANVIDYIMKDSTNAMNIQRITICYCLNDVYGATKTSDLPVMGKQGTTGKLNSFLQEHYYTYKLFKLWAFSNKNSYLAYDEAFYTKKEGYFEKAADVMGRMYYLTGFKRFDFDAIVLPYRGQLKEDKAPDRHELPQGMPLAQTIMYEFNMRHVIAKSPMLYMYKNGPSNKNKLYLFADEIHLSEAGHRLVADFLLRKPTK
jgi:lysophospholipase L1-like esterase